MICYAYYRLPHAEQCFKIEQTEGEPLRLTSLTELNGRQGFVVAPFRVTSAEPILLLRPDRVTAMPVQQPQSTSVVEETILFDKGKYTVCFGQTVCLLQEGIFRKVVLARSASMKNPHTLTPEELFWRACQRYPRLFIALVAMPDGSYWLTATPEILLEGTGCEWRTIALAGTMQLQGDELQGEGESVRWSTKNIQEQRYVATYIANCLKGFSLDYKEEGPRTVRAANLVHLRSDFTFRLDDSSQVGRLLNELHPTPAVCGLPKEATFRHIIEHEQADRQYYSGFMGPLAINDATHLYVSLRCMHITDSEYRLYAGGGILKDSVLEQEWQETEAKMMTMRKIMES